MGMNFGHASNGMNFSTGSSNPVVIIITYQYHTTFEQTPFDINELIIIDFTYNVD